MRGSEGLLPCYHGDSAVLVVFKLLVVMEYSLHSGLGRGRILTRQSKVLLAIYGFIVLLLLSRSWIFFRREFP